MRLRREALLGLGLALIAAGVTFVAVFVAHPHPFRHGGFIAGVVLLVCGCVIVGPQLGERRTIDAEHETQLRRMLTNARTAVENGRHYIYAEPREKSDVDHGMFRAHFPKVSKALMAWNRVVARSDEARRALTVRFATEVRDRRLNSSPYRFDVVVRDLTALTYQRAITSALNEPLELELGPMSIWTALLVSKPPADGIRVGQSRDWAVEMTGISEEDYKKEADKRLMPVNEMLSEAQSWPEALEVQAAAETLLAFDREPLLSKIDADIARRRLPYRRGCPECRHRR